MIIRHILEKYLKEITPGGKVDTHGQARGTWGTAQTRLNFIKNSIWFDLHPRLKPWNSAIRLDIGYGEGNNALWLAEYGFEVTAVDKDEGG